MKGVGTRVHLDTVWGKQGREGESSDEWPSLASTRGSACAPQDTTVRIEDEVHISDTQKI